jgi:dCMP deaminase
MSSRLDKDTYFLEIAKMVAQRSTCPRRQVGCVLVDSKNHIVATGYNGVPTGFVHCIDTPCPGAKYPSGEGLDHCEAIHAEVNAFLQLRSDDELTAYLTVLPCFTCGKMIANSKVKRIVALEEYVHTQTASMLKMAGIKAEIYDSN